MLRIRLTRVGKKNAPAYRVVVADQRKAVKRKFVEIIGHYNPTLSPKELVIDKDRANFWLEKGAQATPTVHNLMVNLGILKDKIDIKYARAPKKAPKEETAPIAAKEEAEVVETAEAVSATEEAPVEEVVSETAAEEIAEVVTEEAPIEEVAAAEEIAEEITETEEPGTSNEEPTTDTQEQATSNEQPAEEEAPETLAEDAETEDKK